MSAKLLPNKRVQLVHGWLLFLVKHILALLG
jgi:hypothetical protein